MIEQQLIEWAVMILESQNADLEWKLHVLSNEFARVGRGQGSFPN